MVHFGNIQVNERLRDSELSAFTSYQVVLPLQANVHGNRIRGSVNFSELYVRTLYFADNDVAGRFVIGILNDTNATAIEPIALKVHHNRVGGSADVFIHESLPATIDLRGSKFASELVLTRGCVEHQEDDCLQRCGLPASGGGFCAVDPDHRLSRANAAPLEIRLPAVEVGSLVWNLRGDNVHWSGPGLRYAYWDPQPRRG